MPVNESGKLLLQNQQVLQGIFLHILLPVGKSLLLILCSGLLFYSALPGPLGRALLVVYQMGRLCGGAHEISGIKAQIFLCGWVGGGGSGGGRVGWVGRGGGVEVVGWVVVGVGMGRGVGSRVHGGGGWCD